MIKKVRIYGAGLAGLVAANLLADKGQGVIWDAGLTVNVVHFYIADWNSYNDRGVYSPYPPKSLAEHKEFLYAFLYWRVRSTVQTDRYSKRGNVNERF